MAQQGVGHTLRAVVHTGIRPGAALLSPYVLGYCASQASPSKAETRSRASGAVGPSSASPPPRAHRTRPFLRSPPGCRPDGRPSRTPPCCAPPVPAGSCRSPRPTAATCRRTRPWPASAGAPPACKRCMRGPRAQSTWLQNPVHTCWDDRGSAARQQAQAQGVRGKSRAREVPGHELGPRAESTLTRCRPMGWNATRPKRSVWPSRVRTTDPVRRRVNRLVDTAQPCAVSSDQPDTADMNQERHWEPCVQVDKRSRSCVETTTAEGPPRASQPLPPMPYPCRLEAHP